MYFCKAPRIYVLTRQERETGVYVCPYCGKALKKGNLSKSEKLFSCTPCRFKITGRDILQEYPNQKVVVDIGIELKKIASAITSNEMDFEKAMNIIQKISHDLFEKAKRETANSINWKVTADRKSSTNYKFQALGDNDFSNTIWLEISYTEKAYISSHFYIMAEINGDGKSVLSLSTRDIEYFQAMVETFKKKNLSKIFKNSKNGSREKMKEIKDFIKNRFNLTPDEEDSDILIYATRAHGDVGNETPGKEDIQLIKKVMSEVKAKFKNLVLRPEIVDEWVQLEIEFKD